MVRDSSSPERLEQDLQNLLSDSAMTAGVQIYMTSPGSMLADLIEELSRKHGSEVVLPIGEFHDPVTRNLGYPVLAEAKATS
jgi:hypothetical protein